MKLAIFSGTFDPVHNGHLELARNALNYVERVAFIVEPEPWSKKNVTLLKHREAMVDLAISAVPEFVLVKNKQEVSGHTTNLILSSLGELKKSAEIYWLMGADTFVGVGEWQDFENCKAYEFIVADRGDKLQEVRRAAHSLGLNVESIELSSGASSSKIRKGDFSEMPSKVADYVSAKKLY